MTKSIFKNTVLILMGLVVLTFTSCEKDSDGDTKAKDIVGIWTIMSSSFEATVNDVDMITYFVDAFGMSELQAQSIADNYFGTMTGTANFKADGTYTMTTVGSNDNGIYKLNADASEITLDEGTVDEMMFNIISLTSSKLEISFTETEEEDMDNDGIDDIIKMIVSLVFTK